MLDRYNTTLGFYEPAVFHLHTIGKGQLNDMKRWDLQQKSTFLHEYIHFLQDITTIQGLNNIYIRGEYIRYVTKLIKEQQSADIHVPIDPLSLGNNVDQNWLARRYTFGTITSVEKVISFKKILVATLTDNNDGKVIPVNGIMVRCVDRKMQITDILFGTLQIMEGMAKLIQEEVYPTATRYSPYNPYYIARDVADMIIPGLSTKTQALIALFVLALQRSNPGCDFVDYLEFKAKDGYNADTLTADVVYGDLQRTIMHLPVGTLNYKDSHTFFVGGAKDVMSEYLGGVWYWQNINKWFQTIIQKGTVLKLNNPFLFQKLAERGDITTNNIFLSLLKEFGTPIVTNNANNFGFIRPNSVMVSKRELINVYAMMQIHQVFLSNGTFSCPLRKFCQHEPCGFRKQKVDKRCLTRPWTRMRKWYRCYFNTWWYFKGFKDVRIV